MTPAEVSDRLPVLLGRSGSKSIYLVQIIQVIVFSVLACGLLLFFQPESDTVFRWGFWIYVGFSLFASGAFFRRWQESMTVPGNPPCMR